MIFFKIYKICCKWKCLFILFLAGRPLTLGYQILGLIADFLNPLAHGDEPWNVP